ncbi:MAG: FecR domain-containing protein [Chitinophagaceae bacterium]|nr:FecR domain-containing protein [Chitinophagaceae bacterium]
MQVPQFFADLFRKYLDNTCSPEEAEYFLSLVNSDEYRAYAALLIDRLISGVPEAHNREHDLKARLDQRLHLILENDYSTTFEPAPVKRLRPWRWVAAASIVVMVAAAVYYWMLPQQQPQLAANHSLSFTPSVNYTRYLTLPDGSTVVLHSGSKLEFPSSFTGATREVILEGEAYFDISHDPGKPFIIHTGKVKTTVLGTAFNIKADEKHVVVSVTRGKVRVETGSEVLAVLAPNEQVEFNLPEEKTKQQKVNANNIVTDWTKEDMVFNGNTFEEIAGMLSKRYGVNVQVNNESLKNCKVRASFSGTEKLEYVASILCGIKNGEYEQLKDGTIVLNGEGCDGPSKE